MPDTMSFPKTLDEFMEQYKIVDTEQVYTNGTELVPIFRIKQWEDAHKPKKGKWIDRSAYCVCNQCGHTEQQFNGVEPIPRHTPFCATCGADMRKEKTDETN